MAERTRNWMVLIRTFQWRWIRKWEKGKPRLASTKQLSVGLERDLHTVVLPARGVREGSLQDSDLGFG